ncbi:hypothetical protein IJG72_06350 [bacterium]|nr:hypothetical protein [bacterium]
MQLPEVFSPSSDPWEVQISIIKNEASLNRTRQIISCSGFQLGFTLESDSTYHLRLWTWDANGNSIFDSALNLSYNDMPNQIICRIYFTGSEYKVDYSTDKENWINIFQITSNTPVRNSGTIFIGTCYNSSYRTEYFTGSIDLSDTSISFNGVEWWRGVSPNRELMHGILSNYTDDGSAVTLNCFANGDTSVVLTPDNNYNGTYLGTVNIQAHTAYNYDPDTGEWTPNV